MFSPSRDADPSQDPEAPPSDLSLDARLAAGLSEIDAAGLRRSLRTVASAQGPRIELGGRRVLNFSSNDYLGLAGDPAMVEAACRAARDFGTGTGASRLLSGTQSLHAELEETLAGFKDTGAALAFSCGYATALGVIPSLVAKGDVVIIDKLAHACLVDGARLSGADLRVFPHNDTDRLDSHLRWARERSAGCRVLVVTESVFSMDGDLAPLAEIVELKDRHGAWLLLDEAHGTGVIGPGGRGLAHATGLHQLVDVHMGTLGKALGSAGGYIAGSRTLVDHLVNRARSFIFSTAPPAAQAAAATAAIRWIQTPDGLARIASLDRLRAALAAALPDKLAGPPPAAIVPVMVGGEADAVALAAACLASGAWIPAVRYPTVPKGKARLRITLTATHSMEDVDSVACLLRNVAARKEESRSAKSPARFLREKISARRGSGQPAPRGVS